MIGKTILHYKITELLGKGGMGVVYQAEDTKLKRTVALKFLPPNALDNEGDKARFVHEAQSAAALDHPNICTVYEINEADEQTFISMAYLPGGSLGDKMKEGPRSTKEILDIAIQAARGLKAAHDKGIIHRDIKPSNIMFSESGQVTVMDFGLAKSKHQTHVTKLKTTVGTVAYMSPEQTRGDKVDARTDIWSIGVILYEMATGQRPFRGDYDEAVIYSILNEPPKPVAELREDLDPNLVYIIEKATAKDVDERYANFGEMLNDLELLRDELRSGESRVWSSSRSRVAPAPGDSFVKKIFSARVLVPVFALIVIGAVIAAILGQQGGVVTETIAVTDEQGQTIERAVPKSEFRKNFALYPFDNKTGDPENDWLTAALAVLLETDLLQDQILNVRSAYNPTGMEHLRRAGFARWSEAPWNLKRQVAREAQYDYLVTGSLKIEGNEYLVTRSLHNSETGRLATQKVYRGKDMFALADSITLELKKDLEVPEDYLADVQDLPVAETMTTSIEALKYFAMATMNLAEDQSWEQAAANLDLAVAADSTFAFAWFQMLDVSLNTNRAEKTEIALQNAMRYVFKLPERIQFMLKSFYYILKKEPEKGIAVLEMMTDLYPEDIIGRQMLAGQLSVRKRWDEAIAVYEEILEIDPNRSEFFQTIGALYRTRGDYGKALEYYERYADKHPDLVGSFTPIADIYRRQGELENAATYYEKALLIKPGNVTAILNLANIDTRLGKFDDAIAKYEEAISVSKSAQERMEIFDSFGGFYRLRGEMATSLDYVQKSWVEMRQISAPTQALIQELFDAHYFVIAGRTERAFEIVEAARKQMQSPYDELVPLGYLFVYLEMEEPDSAEVAVKGLMPFIDGYGLETLRDEAIMAEGRIAELRENYELAIQKYQTALELSPTQTDRNVDIGRCYRKLGRVDDAEAVLEKMLKVYPFHPETHYEMALIHAERGDQKKAIDALNKALTVWENADPEFKPAKQARDKLAEWTS